MALTHVLAWKEGLGYQPTTAEQALKDYPNTVSAKSEIFICSICGENVVFVVANKQEPHFRHKKDNEYKDKECEDRAKKYDIASASLANQKAIKDFPLRIKTTYQKYYLEIGILPLSEDQFQEYKDYKLFISTKNNPDESDDELSIQEHFKSDGIYWHTFHWQPPKQFFLNLSENKALPPQWPQQIKGIEEVAIFEGATGEKLPSFCEVEVGIEYILATDRNTDFNAHYTDVEVKLIPKEEHNWIHWSLHRVKALKFTKNASDFFLQFKAILTNQVPHFFPLWPRCIQDTNIIYHYSNTSDILLFVNGMGSQVTLFPSQKNFDLGERKSQLICFKPENRKQLRIDSSSGMALCRNSHMLQFVYFVYRQMNKAPSHIEVHVKDIKGKEIHEDIFSKTKLLHITASFDGEVWIEQKNRICEKRILKAKEEITIATSLVQRIIILQGLDRVRTLVSVDVHKQKNCSIDDLSLYHRLQAMQGDEIVCPHSIAQALYSFRGYFATSRWLEARQQEGSISVRALSLIQSIIKIISK